MRAPRVERKVSVARGDLLRLFGAYKAQELAYDRSHARAWRSVKINKELAGQRVAAIDCLRGRRQQIGPAVRTRYGECLRARRRQEMARETDGAVIACHSLHDGRSHRLGAMSSRYSPPARTVERKTP
jgi:hypothetical protein